ncbi:Eukaryotic translation initiation factor 2-alpha kinase 2 [Taenia crassiceps]|uniref:non-specific serine/threonine protein kinase n=1 Tax=Taenia crassiceps TaxID=6207 RepID=A0ABR4Q1Q0_9CEST
MVIHYSSLQVIVDIEITVRGIHIDHEHWADLLQFLLRYNSLEGASAGDHKSGGHRCRQNTPFYYRMNRNEEFDHFICIGGGAFSMVYSAVHRLDGKAYALKVIRDISSPKSLKHAKIEVDVLARLDHPNIVRYFGCWVEPQPIARLTVQPLHSSDPLQSNGASSAAAQSWISNASTGDANCRLLRLVDAEVDSGEEDLVDSTTTSEEASEDVGAGDSRALAVRESRVVQFSVSELNARPVTLVIQMELCESTLTGWMQWRNNSLTAPIAPDYTRPSLLDRSYRAEVRWIFDQIVKGIHHLHQKGILHRDIKPANVFIQGPPLAAVTGSTCEAEGELACTSAQCFHRCRVKIGDFGLSTFLERPMEPQIRPVIEEVPEGKDPGPSTALQTIPSHEPRLLTGNLGTLFYTAPEVLKSNSKGRSLYNQKADVYSLGIVLFQMLYPCKTETEMARRIDNFHANPEAEDALPKFLTDCWPLEASLLRRMLKPKPSDRPETIEILSELASTSQVIDGTGPKDRQCSKAEPSLVNELRIRNRQLEKENAELRRRLGFLIEPKE